MDEAQLTSVLAVVLSRAAERILLVLVGALAVYLGYSLFRHIPSVDKATGRLQLPGGASIVLTRIGPGVFFALFGTGLIGYSVASPIDFELPTAAGAVSYSGLGQRDPAPAAAVIPRAGPDAATAAARLNGLLADARRRLDPPKAAEIEAAIRAAKYALILTQWQPEWGDRGAFERWVREQGDKDPPPDLSPGASLTFHTVLP
ncbi:MAG TPA: hypothetical protein VHG30_14560 [Microvirga sp.]|jgi:hypothetical protein|nr:hypothetical protein [Microvirga sp.]